MSTFHRLSIKMDIRSVAQHNRLPLSPSQWEGVTPDASASAIPPSSQEGGEGGWPSCEPSIEGRCPVFGTGRSAAAGDSGFQDEAIAKNLPTILKKIADSHALLTLRP